MNNQLRHGSAKRYDVRKNIDHFILLQIWFELENVRRQNTKCCVWYFTLGALVQYIFLPQLQLLLYYTQQYNFLRAENQFWMMHSLFTSTWTKVVVF